MPKSQPQEGIFNKMRRRLTVTGSLETIDGVSKLSVNDSEDDISGEEVSEPDFP
jgi:hypothetical protein